MNALTTKALSLALVVALWAILSHLGKLPLQLWPVIVGLACYVGAGGGMMGLQKSILGSASGVVWALLYVTVTTSLGHQDIVDALDHARIAQGPGGPAEMVPGQHHVRMNMYIARSEGGTFKVVENLGHIDPKECEVARS